jgi:SAM-dependent methyltransferase
MTAAASRWRCPACHARALRQESGEVSCGACRTRYPLIAGRPLLTAPGNELFGPQRYATATPARAGGSRRWAPDPSVNLSREPCLQDLARRLAPAGDAAVLLVGSGSQRHDVERLFARATPGGAAIAVIACDVAADAEVDVLCDAHELPFGDASFDAVVTTAVLEHVADPARAMAEIERVLAPGGYLYSEIPFMQQVHEGAYDFTRFTMSGHRRLAAGFEELGSGVVAGPATSLAWAIEHLALALAGGRRGRFAAKFVVRWSFGWLKLLDRALAARPAAQDGASCTYFYGRRTDTRRSDAAIVAAYGGAQR